MTYPLDINAQDALLIGSETDLLHQRWHIVGAVMETLASSGRVFGVV